MILITEYFLNVFFMDPHKPEFSDLTSILGAYLLIVELANHKKAGFASVLLLSVPAWLKCSFMGGDIPRRHVSYRHFWNDIHWEPWKAVKAFLSCQLLIYLSVVHLRKREAMDRALPDRKL